MKAVPERMDFAASPLLLYYEVTQACDLACKHCRASAISRRNPDELDSQAARTLLDQVLEFPQPPTVVITGGDPLKRADLFELISYGIGRGLSIALTPSATPLATTDALRRAREAGVELLGISLDGANAETHDLFRGWEGSFARTMAMLSDARELGFRVQVNTTLSRRNFAQLDRLAELLAGYGIVMWSVFFLVPVGRGIGEECIAPLEYEQAFATLWRHAQRQPYAIKTTEAPHYRRYVIEQSRAAGRGAESAPSPENALATVHGEGPSFPTPPRRARFDSIAALATGTMSGAGTETTNSRPASRAAGLLARGRRHLGVRDGNGILFVSHRGEICPAGFLPLVCGLFPQDSIVDVYQRHEAFVALRQPNGFGGKCGVCEYRNVCGGSRSRAYAVCGDPLAADPDCVYEPQRQAALV